MYYVKKYYILGGVMKHHNLYTAIMLSLLGSSTSMVWAGDASENSNKSDVLPVIHLKADHEASAYTVKKSKSATKLDLSLKETPQSVSVITSEQIQDQGLKDTYDILNQTPGIHVMRYGAKGAIGRGGEYAFYYARGKQIINYQLDGVMTAPAVDFRSGSALSNLDAAIFDNVTVVKGATGLTNGAGYPSASVGLNRKHATSVVPTGTVRLSGGSWNNMRSEFDAQGGLNQDGSVRGRVVAAYEQGDSWKDWGDFRKGVLYGIVDADLTEKTQLSVGTMVSQNRSDGLSVHGLDMYGYDNTRNPYKPSFNAAPRWAYSKVETLNAFTSLKHEFANRWQVQGNYNYIDQNIDGIYGVIGTAPRYGEDKANFAFGRDPSNPKEHSVDVSVLGPYQLFGREHELMAGASYQSIRNAVDTYNATGTYSIKPSQWDGNVPLPTITKSGESLKKFDQTGYYVATRLNPIEPLHVIVGSRVSDYKFNDNNKILSNYAKVTPYAGLTFDLTSDLTAYASYTNIYLPQTSRDYNYEYLDPQEGDNYEIGLKSALFEDRLNLSAAYFQAKMDNVAVVAGKYLTEEEAKKISSSLKANDNYYRTAKGVKTEGFELEANGEVVDGLNLQAGYTYVSSKEKGKAVNANIPKNMFKVFATYKLPVLPSLTVGGGVRWQSKFYDENAKGLQAELYTQKGFAVADLMAKYELNKNVSLGLNVNNLTDKEYRLNTWANTYGDPRSYTGSITLKY